MIESYYIDAMTLQAKARQICLCKRIAFPDTREGVIEQYLKATLEKHKLRRIVAEWDNENKVYHILALRNIVDNS